MRTHAQAVIVGGGIMGTSLLYHLAKEGWTDCVLVEKARNLPRLSIAHVADLPWTTSREETPPGQLRGRALVPRLRDRVSGPDARHGHQQRVSVRMIAGSIELFSPLYSDVTTLTHCADCAHAG